MSDFHPIDPIVGLQPIATKSTTQNHPLGMRIKAVDLASTNYGVGEFIYLKGAASTVVGSCVHFNADDGTTALVVADAIGPVGFAMSTNAEATSYGWYQIYGKCVSKVAAGFADNAAMYITATAGILDDAVVAGDHIKNCKGASAIDTPLTGLAEVEAWYPYTDNMVDAAV